MSTQSNEQTEQELTIALDVLAAVSDCTDSDLFTEWHQSLQSNIAGLMNTINLLQKQTALDSAGDTVQ